MPALAVASALLAACSGTEAAGSTSGGPAAGSTTASTAATTTAPTVSAEEQITPPATEPAPTVAEVELPLPAPDGDAFYAPPDPIPGTKPGDLIWARPIDSAPAGSRGWQVLYRSESLAGEAIGVSGVVFVPSAPLSSELPVLSWAHGTTGLGDSCAPSSEYAVGGSSEAMLAQTVTTLGWAFVATDYEGLGTPGVHPYLVGQSEGRGVLDIVRAAQQLQGASVATSSPVAIFGHSQGGHAALMAGELAASYAPELNVVGTVAGAPPGDIGLIESATAAAGDFLTGGFSLMIDAGYLAAYPDLPVEAVVAAAGRKALDAVGDTCTGEAFELAASVPGTQLDGTKNPDWADAYAANSPGHVAPSAPVLIIHGDADQVVPQVLSKLILDDYCALGATVERTVYPGADHLTVITLGLADVQLWIAQRLTGVPAGSSC